MNSTWINRLLAGLVVLIVSALPASAADEVSAEVMKALRAAFESGQQPLKIASVSDSPLDGIYEVQLADGPLVYATAGGEFFLVGDLYSNDGADGFVNLSEKRRDDQRMAQLEAVNVDDMIVFPATGKTLAHLTVFTDVTCFYCQKLHREVPELNRRGVEVRYLAYPRAGVGSDGYRKLASAWCSDNPQDTLTRLKNKEEVTEKVCPENPVADQYALGQKMGVRGTPAIVTSSGQMIPGYQDADALVGMLGIE
jgi:thiol:disulfide interchange protein DsbC